MSFRDFYSRLREIDRNLILSPRDFGIVKCRSLPKRFKIGERVKLRLEMHGRIKGEMIGIARDRVIQITDTNKKIGEVVNVRITRNQHNIYVATPV